MDEGNQKTTGQEPQSGWQYAPSSGPANTPTPNPGPSAPAPGDVEWTASEFVAHQKGFAWYLGFGGIGLLLAVGIFALTRDIFSVVVIVILSCVLGYATSRQPRVLTYRLDRSGLTIGQKFHPYGEFKSFALINEGAFTSITFAPLKRFMPPLSIYFSPEDEHAIMTALGAHLPMQPAVRDGFDQLMRRVRF